MRFEELPNHARLKIFSAPRPLSAFESEQLLKEVDSFLVSWQSHKQPVTAAREWKYDHFLLIGIDESAVSLSGCSIDSLNHTLEPLSRGLGVNFFKGAPLFYREGERICSAERYAFKKLVESGIIGEETIVFNSLVETMAEYRAGKWEVPFKESWHASAFKTLKSVES